MFQQHLLGWRLPLGTKLLHNVLFCFGDLFSVIITGSFTAYHSWGNSLLFNATIGAVFPWKPQIFQLQSLVCVWQ